MFYRYLILFVSLSSYSCLGRNVFSDVQIGRRAFASERAAPSFRFPGQIPPEAIIQQRWAKFDWNTSEVSQTLLSVSSDDFDADTFVVNLFEHAKATVSSIAQHHDDDAGLWQIKTKLSLGDEMLLSEEEEDFTSGQMLVTMTDDGGLFGYAQAGTRRFRMEGSKDATKITEIDTDAYGRTLHSTIAPADVVDDGVVAPAEASAVHNVTELAIPTVRVLILFSELDIDCGALPEATLLLLENAYQANLRDIFDQYEVTIEVVAHCLSGHPSMDSSEHLTFLTSSLGVQTHAV